MAKICKKKTKSGIHPFLVHEEEAYSKALLSAMDKEKSAVLMVNTVGVDYMVVGNHECDSGPEFARKRIWESNFLKQSKET